MSTIGKHQVSLKIRVRYSECDAQQVVFNARYADYADLAATEYMRALLGSFQALLDSGFDNQVVNLTIDWRASAIFDDVLLLECKLVHVGNSSFRLQTLMYVEGKSENKLVATANTTYVVVDSKTYQKASIPESMRALFAADLNAHIDQAGV
jgi:acyl-CoA thioester hydrolase